MHTVVMAAISYMATSTAFPSSLARGLVVPIMMVAAVSASGLGFAASALHNGFFQLSKLLKNF